MTKSKSESVLNEKKLLLFIIILVICTASSNYVYAASYTDIASNEEWEVLKHTNQKRLDCGLEPLGTNGSLQWISDVRVREIVNNFSHTRPDGTDCFTAFDSIMYNYAGENIAAGQITPHEVVIAWWNSPGHKANILSNNYLHMGTGYSYNDNTYYYNYWTQEFVGGCSVYGVSINNENKVLSYKKGTSINNMNRYLKVRCSSHGTTYVPITTKMCTNYNSKELGYQTIKIKYMNNYYYMKVNIVEKKLGKVKNVSASEISSKGVKLRWDKLSDAKAYEIYRATKKNGSYKRIQTTGSRRYTDKNIKLRKTYYYKINSYRRGNDGKKEYGIFSGILRVRI